MLRIYTSYEANVPVKVSFIALSFQLNCLRTSNKLILGELICPKHIYFPKHFFIVSPLICVIWIQLTRTDAVFSRIALVSRFCAENQLSGKIPENIAKLLFYQNNHGARRRDGEGPRGAHTTWWHWPSQAAPQGGVAASGTPSTSP